MSGSGEEHGVFGVLENDEELLEDDDRRRVDRKSELKDEVREFDDIDRDGDGASDIMGLTPR